MGLLRGNKDEESVRRAMAHLLSGGVARGAYGQVAMDGEWLTIRHQRRTIGIGNGLPAEQRIPIANITAVAIREPGFSNGYTGYIHFSLLGGLDHQIGGFFNPATDENTVTFIPSHLAEFLAVKRYVEGKISGGALAPSRRDGATRIEQLKQLAELRESGVLSESEFQAEKRRLLS